MSERDDLLAAIAAIEAQQDLLGQSAIEAATAPLRARLAALRGAAAPAPEAERKQITVMFADLSGFTTLSETGGPSMTLDLILARRPSES